MERYEITLEQIETRITRRIELSERWPSDLRLHDLQRLSNSVDALWDVFEMIDLGTKERLEKMVMVAIEDCIGIKRKAAC